MLEAWGPSWPSQAGQPKRGMPQQRMHVNRHLFILPVCMMVPVEDPIQVSEAAVAGNRGRKGPADKRIQRFYM